jgi:hypothetical protein
MIWQVKSHLSLYFFFFSAFPGEAAATGEAPGEPELSAGLIMAWSGGASWLVLSSAVSLPPHGLLEQLQKRHLHPHLHAFPPDPPLHPQVHAAQHFPPGDPTAPAGDLDDFAFFFSSFPGEAATGEAPGDFASAGGVAGPPAAPGDLGDFDFFFPSFPGEAATGEAPGESAGLTMAWPGDAPGLALASVAGELGGLAAASATGDLGDLGDLAFFFPSFPGEAAGEPEESAGLTMAWSGDFASAGPGEPVGDFPDIICWSACAFQREIC